MLTSRWLTNGVLRFKNRQNARRRRRTAASPAVAEVLEVRRMLAVHIQLALGGELTIDGSPSDDVAQVSYGKGDTIRVSVRTGQDTIAESYQQSDVMKIIFHGGSGDDEFRNLTALPVDAHGDDGHDKLTGGSNNDALFGDRGHDVLLGGEGHDALYGGLGNDILIGRTGDDTLTGGDGADKLFGEAGNDSLTGGEGNDQLYGSHGDDSLRGGTGNDILDGGVGNDFLNGDLGVDILQGNAGHDDLNGGGGRDTLRGGAGNDQLTGGEGQDDLIGEAGDDWLNGSAGNDSLKGGDGKDELLGGIGDDILAGGAHDDVLRGGIGNDQLYGGTGNDQLHGDSGNDTLNGNSGVDELFGGAGQNTAINGTLGAIQNELHVKDFGAVGDGLTDDTHAVQAAINAAEGGQTLYIDPGTYRLTDVILISSHTTITGAGTLSVLKFTWKDQTQGPDFHLGNRNRKDTDAGDSNIVLRDFVVEGGDTGLPYGEDQNSVTHGISFRKVSDLQVTGVQVRKVSGFGIANTGLVRGTFTENNIHDVGRDGITSFPLIRENDPSFSGYPLTDLLISNNEFVNVGDDAIAVHAGTASSVNLTNAPNNITITHNTITGRQTNHALAQGRGIVLSGVHQALVANNTIQDTVSTGILIQSWGASPTGALIRSQNVQVLNNIIVRAGRAIGLDRVKFGIQVKGADLIELANNTITDAADRGVDVRDASDVIVTSNQIVGSGGEYAILIAGGDDYSVSRINVTYNTVDHHLQPGIFLHNVIAGVEEHNQVTYTP
jgi:Ca2+-binding RTX toxin-like protein